MGSRFGPNYVCLFVGHIEKQIFQQYRGETPDPYKRYIDDIVAAVSGTKEDLEDFANFVNNFHPSLKFPLRQQTSLPGSLFDSIL